MNKVAKFAKVSFEQFEKDIKDTFGDKYTTHEIHEIYENIKLPKRATKGSAGYDFYSPIDFNLKSGQFIKIPTGVRVFIDAGWWLGVLPRSGHGFKYQVRLANTMGVVDSDYVMSSNEGHMFIKLVNGSPDWKELNIKTGDAFCQSIFSPYGITYDDDADGIRDGGFGSTGK